MATDNSAKLSQRTVNAAIEPHGHYQRLATRSEKTAKKKDEEEEEKKGKGRIIKMVLQNETA